MVLCFVLDCKHHVESHTCSSLHSPQMKVRRNVLGILNFLKRNKCCNACSLTAVVALRIYNTFSLLIMLYSPYGTEARPVKADIVDNTISI